MAGEWRGRFHRYLEQQGTAELVVQQPLSLGGMAVIDDLQNLVQSHGVKATRSRECADGLLNKLGASAVQNILKSPKPWADLKARTNALSPPVKIVTSDELQEMIQAKLQQGGAIGRKSNKAKTTTQKEQDRFHLKADQVVVPPSVFRQADGIELQQINPSQINKRSQGIVVVNIDEAIPYFSLSSAVTTEGLGLLILDFDDQRIPQAKQIVKVPAHCSKTNEPIIFTAALLQLGCKKVQRNIPETCLAVQEVANQVLRVVIYKDQFPHDWNAFSANPVRQIMTQSVLSEHQTNVLDVWDRQFLTSRLTKCSPTEANLFAVNLRVQSVAVADICKLGGKDGIYIEPRDATGRHPDDSFQVIWLHRTTYGEAALANQTTQCESTLVRSGDRYGIRVSHEDAESVYHAHRPDLVFLRGADLKRYTIGPLPYGTTKQSLAKIFRSWEWPARPIGPQGQAKDRSGVNWLLQASQPPSHWIFQLAHGDVMITPENPNPSKQTPKTAPVLASENTIRTLKSAANGSEAKREDPWIHRDPWQPQPTAKEIPVSQLTALQTRIEASVEQKLRDSIGDSPMPSSTDPRVDMLEQQVHRMTNDFQQYQQQQSTHNHAVATQIQAIDSKVDQHGHSIQSMIDHKLEDQMVRIEQLFAKRARME